MTQFSYQLVEDTAKSFTSEPENPASRCAGGPEKHERNSPSEGDVQDHSRQWEC
jgi:hypothetical protein